MVKRKGKYGSFYGCSNFPTCRSTVKVEEEFCR
ncbi:topoisomerase DNA-binding C4 zinc finger domain-containing protein [Peribacillus psychrosaccharolyticus]|uniref:Topoisomerase DNA-binding C4 zinc finger domain-containing protein n=1 Tax=Peribacillus psychrosaccharolyticus TaxID=1407 RepID=A0A974S0U3_PERPY|nr:topoisomerase DNA-binding C4 zinc finger domain-containing protein [Peribacillus psychrosaccharolyticus]QQT00718.1 topoisomerase DNA-binding C4 zinc finger domain-containing protein [Peribacillus psychrosaccharolyticus]